MVTRTWTNSLRVYFLGFNLKRDVTPSKMGKISPDLD